jgi:hypothetical protein
MSTRTGTNEFHGDLYEFLRNRELNANNFFNNRIGTARPAFSQNQFGFTNGGPVIKNRTFYFLSYEGFILRQGTTNLTTVPTAAMRSGNFSGPNIPAIFDPLTTTLVSGVYTRQPFSGNIIPANRLNPAATNLAPQLWPLPNLPGAVNNFQVTYTRPFNYNQYMGRFDHQISPNQQLFGRSPGGTRTTRQIQRCSTQRARGTSMQHIRPFLVTRIRSRRPQSRTYGYRTYVSSIGPFPFPAATTT